MKRKLFFIGFIILLLFMMQDTFLLTASSFLPKKDVNEKPQLVVLNKEKHIVKQDELVLYEKTTPVHNSIVTEDTKDELESGDIVIEDLSLKNNNEPVERAFDYISIPNVITSDFVLGSTQQEVDNNNVCLMSKIGSVFGEEQPKLMGGHKEYVLGGLYKTELGSIITVQYEGIEYKYQVIESLYCTEDEVNDDFIDNEGNGHLELWNGNDILQIYTCYGNHIDGRWFIKAKRV